MIIPALTYDANRLGACTDQVVQCLILVNPTSGPTSRPEGHESRSLKVEFVDGSAEEFVVFGVGTWPAAFDVVDPQPVELACDLQLVFDRERDAFELASIAQSRVIDLDFLRHSAGCCIGHGLPS